MLSKLTDHIELVLTYLTPRGDFICDLFNGGTTEYVGSLEKLDNEEADDPDIQSILGSSPVLTDRFCFCVHDKTIYANNVSNGTFEDVASNWR